MKRSAVLVAAVILLAAAIPAFAAKGKAPHSTKATYHVHLTDLVATGNVQTFTVNLVGAGGTESVAGHGFCIVQAATYTTCETVVTDKFGSLTSTWDAPASVTKVVAAITGGTGRYRNARGEATITQEGTDATRFTVVIRRIG